MSDIHCEFVNACGFGHLEKVAMYVHQLLDNNHHETNRIVLTNGFNTAIRKGHEKIVKYLLETGDESLINNTVRHGSTFLWAISEGHENIVSLLLAHPDVDVNHRQGEPLLTAIRKNRYAIVEQLLSHPVIDINIRNGLPLAMICDYNWSMRLEMLKLFLNRTDLLININHGEAIKRAIKSRESSIVVQLLLAHPDMNINGVGQDCSLLNTAMVFDNFDAFHILLAHPDLQIRVVEFVLLLACEKFMKFLFLLLTHPSFVKASNEDKQKVLDIMLLRTKNHADDIAWFLVKHPFLCIHLNNENKLKKQLYKQQECMIDDKITLENAYCLVVLRKIILCTIHVHLADF
jgi:ankyrin repeat protein